MRRVLSLFAAAVLLAAPFAAAAQEQKPAAPAVPLVSIYGTLNVNFQITAARGATNPAQTVEARNALSTDSSNIGVRGGLTVNEYVGATYQCEISAAVDGINPAGICGRNSRLGVTGNWGTLWYGNWDTPYKAVAYGTKVDDPFMNTDVFGFNGVMGSPGFNYRSSGWSTASNTSTPGFDIRANNSVGYHSPKFYGLSAKIQYSADEFKNANGNQNPNLYGAALNWDYAVVTAGDVKVSLSVLGAYERHDDGYALPGINAAAGAAFGSTAANTAVATAALPSSTVDSAWRVGAGVQLDTSAGATTVGGMYEKLTLEQGQVAVGAITKYERGALQVALKHRYGDHELRARWNQAEKGSVTLNGAVGSTVGYGATMLALGYAYYFAPSFQVYLHYAQILNGFNAQYTFSIGGSPAVAGLTPRGADPKALGLGLRYAF